MYKKTVNDGWDVPCTELSIGPIATSNNSPGFGRTLKIGHHTIVAGAYSYYNGAGK